MVPCETNDEHPALLDEVGVEVFVSESGARGMERRVGEIQIRHRYNGGQVETRDLGGAFVFRALFVPDGFDSTVNGGRQSQRTTAQVSNN